MTAATTPQLFDDAPRLGGVQALEAGPAPRLRARAARVAERLRDTVALTKPRLSGLVLVTTAGGMWLAGTELPWWRWVLTLLGTAGTVGAANAFNCYIERDTDGSMRRTARRPLPARRLGAGYARGFAAVLAAVAFPVLYVGSNALTLGLGALALCAYVLVYTPMKARTHWAMQVGAVSGALPPLMGWTAATGKIQLPGLALFAILFVWQLPHFIAIALFLRDDYRAAGLTNLPLQRGVPTAWRHAVWYLWLLVPLGALPFAVGGAGAGYAAAAIGLGVGFLVVGLLGRRRSADERWARRLFFASLVYLTALFAALGLDGGARRQPVRGWTGGGAPAPVAGDAASAAADRTMDEVTR